MPVLLHYLIRDRQTQGDTFSVFIAESERNDTPAVVAMVLTMFKECLIKGLDVELLITQKEANA